MDYGIAHGFINAWISRSSYDCDGFYTMGRSHYSYSAGNGGFVSILAYAQITLVGILNLRKEMLRLSSRIVILNNQGNG